MGKGCLLNQLKAKYLKATNPGGAANFESEYLGYCIPPTMHMIWPNIWLNRKENCTLSEWGDSLIILGLYDYDISGKAGPASVKTAEYSERETEYALEWVAESLTEITAFQVQLAEGLHGTPFDTEVR